MDTTTPDDVIADAILAFFKDTFNEDVEIYPPSPATQIDGQEGFSIDTDWGMSFTIPLFGATRGAVALKFFSHVRHVFQFVVDNRRSGPWYDGGRRHSRKERRKAREMVAKFDAWAAEHLKVQ